MEFHNLDARISQIVMTCMTICYSSMRYFGYLASLVSKAIIFSLYLDLSIAAKILFTASPPPYTKP
jgi:hypothetical protein